MKTFLSLIAVLGLATPAAAQMGPMPGMDMPAKPAAKPKLKPKPKPKRQVARVPTRAPARAAHPSKRRAAAAPARPAPAHASHPALTPPAPETMDKMPGMEMPAKPASSSDTPQDIATMPGMDTSAPSAGAAQQHPGDDMAGMPGMESSDTQIGTAPAPVPPEDHAADAVFDPAEMARARAGLRRENGAFNGSMVLFDLAELQIRNGRDGYRWEGEAWFGGDINRLQLKYEGAGNFGEQIADIELQALWSRAISPFFNAHLGARHDIVPNPSRTYAVAGIEGIAPYWFHVNGALFLSDKGEFSGRFEGSYDERITQRLILQPRVEVNLSAQDVPALGIGSGLSEFELGARLRYEVRKEFAPYVGVEWARKTGDTARFARLRGEDPNRVNFVAGIRFWF